MKKEKNILIAFILNLGFSVFELIGGLFTGSVAILSDSIHDLGDAASIGISFLLEKKSHKQPDKKYTYGYLRYSVAGGLITTLILLLGSAAVIYNAISRIIAPTDINYNGMIILALIGVCVNFCAAFFTRGSDSVNQKAVNLHMLEDVLGWSVVLVGAIVMRFTDFALIDPIMSVGVAIFILINAIKNLKEIFDILFEKAPDDIDVEEIREHLLEIEGVSDVHHIHIWSMDGCNSYATMHIVSSADPHTVKHKIREELSEHGISHSTLELEREGEICDEKCCHVDTDTHANHHHHHHHHH